MKKKSGAKYFVLLLFLMVVVVSFLIADAFGLGSLIQAKSHPLENQKANFVQNKMLLFLIDFKSFMCLHCLDSFLDFYHLISPFFERGMIWAILVLEKTGKEEVKESSIRIAQKKLRGFIKANNIKFPIIVDRFHVFNSIEEKGTSVFLFDREKKILKRYIFPLGQSQLREIIDYIQN